MNMRRSIPDERELRLRATELRWYLLPLLQESPSNRDARLAQVPADLRDLVKTRLDEWNILPPPLQQEFLENEQPALFRDWTFARSPARRQIPPARWNALTDAAETNIRRSSTNSLN